MRLASVGKPGEVQAAAIENNRHSAVSVRFLPYLKM